MTRGATLVGVDPRDTHGTRFQTGSSSFFSALPGPSTPTYSKLKVAASFHLATASVHAAPGDHESSLRTPSRLTRHTAISLLHWTSQISAVTRRWRSGASCGSVGNSKRRLVVLCSRVNVVASPAVV